MRVLLLDIVRVFGLEFIVDVFYGVELWYSAVGGV